MGDKVGTWQAFTNVNYKGPQANLNEGQLYKTPGEMGLGAPVKSMKKQVVSAQ